MSGVLAELCGFAELPEAATAIHKSVLAALCAHAYHTTGECNVGVKTMARQAACVRNSTRAALDDLEDWGAIDIDRSNHTMHRYRVNEEWLRAHVYERYGGSRADPGGGQPLAPSDSARGSKSKAEGVKKAPQGGQPLPPNHGLNHGSNHGGQAETDAARGHERSLALTPAPNTLDRPLKDDLDLAATLLEYSTGRQWMDLRFGSVKRWHERLLETGLPTSQAGLIVSDIAGLAWQEADPVACLDDMMRRYLAAMEPKGST